MNKNIFLLLVVSLTAHAMNRDISRMLLAEKEANSMQRKLDEGGYVLTPRSHTRFNNNPHLRSQYCNGLQGLRDNLIENGLNLEQSSQQALEENIDMAARIMARFTKIVEERYKNEKTTKPS